MQKKRHWFVWIVLITVGVAAGFYLNRDEPKQVQTALVERATVEHTVANTRVGTIKACYRSRLSPSIGGQVAKLHVTEGDVVKKGALLLELWNRDRKAQLQQSQAMKKFAERDLERICIIADADKRESGRVERLAERKLASEELVDQHKSKADASRLACTSAAAKNEQAEAAVALARASLDQTYLRAPFAGIVAEVTGEVGEFTTPSPPGVATPPAIDLLTNDCHYVTAPIDEVDAAVLSVGLPVRVTMDAFKEQVFSGKVRRVAAHVEDREKQARTVDVEVDLTEVINVSLIAGYSADIEVLVAIRENTLRIPSEALLDTPASEQQKVYVLGKDNIVIEKDVVTGISNWRYTEVVSGLTVGDEVIMALGQKDIVAGMTVMTSNE